MEKPKRIHLLGDGRHEEAVAGGTISPGHLIKLNGDGEVVVHATSGGAGEAAFALEDALQGRTIAQNYAEDDVVSFVLAERGDVVYGILAAGEDVDAGDFLSSNGDGTLAKSSGGDIPLAVALEALDLSASAAVDTHIRARVL